MKRVINEIIVHCTDTKVTQNFDISDVRQWHISRGFNDVGYHYYIKLDGTVQLGRALKVAGAHCKGHNSHSIGICFEGGLNADGTKWDGPLEAQIESFFIVFDYIDALIPNIKVSNHYEYSTKTCPNFNIHEYLQ